MAATWQVKFASLISNTDASQFLRVLLSHDDSFKFQPDGDNSDQATACTFTCKGSVKSYKGLHAWIHVHEETIEINGVRIISIDLLHSSENHEGTEHSSGPTNSLGMVAIVQSEHMKKIEVFDQHPLKWTFEVANTQSITSATDALALEDHFYRLIFWHKMPKAIQIKKLPTTIQFTVSSNHQTFKLLRIPLK